MCFGITSKIIYANKKPPMFTGGLLAGVVRPLGLFLVLAIRMAASRFPFLLSSRRAPLKGSSSLIRLFMSRELNDMCV